MAVFFVNGYLRINTVTNFTNYHEKLVEIYEISVSNFLEAES